MEVRKEHGHIHLMIIYSRELKDTYLLKRYHLSIEREKERERGGGPQWGPGKRELKTNGLRPLDRKGTPRIYTRSCRP